MLEGWLPKSSMPALPEMNGGPLRDCTIVIFVEEDGGDWHARRLQLAIEARGGAVITTSPSQLGARTRTSRKSLREGGREGSLTNAFKRTHR